MSTRTTAWPCPWATDRPPQLHLSSPGAGQTADKAAVSFPVRPAISSPALGRRALGVCVWRWGGKGRRYFQVTVIVRGWEVTGGPEYLQRFGHTYFWVSTYKFLSHVERPCPGTPTLPADPGLRGWGPCLTLQVVKGVRWRERTDSSEHSSGMRLKRGPRSSPQM